MTELGYPYLTDQNGVFEDGHFPVTVSNLYDRRVSTAIGYLDPPTRLRENLEIRSETQVGEILFDGLRAVGVKAERRGVVRDFHGRTRWCCAAGRCIRPRTCSVPASARPAIWPTWASRSATTCRASGRT